MGCGCKWEGSYLTLIITCFTEWERDREREGGREKGERRREEWRERVSVCLVHDGAGLYSTGLFKFQELFESYDIKLVVWNWPWWYCLYHRNRQPQQMVIPKDSAVKYLSLVHTDSFFHMVLGIKLRALSMLCTYFITKLYRQPPYWFMWVLH